MQVQASLMKASLKNSVLVGGFVWAPRRAGARRWGAFSPTPLRAIGFQLLFYGHLRGFGCQCKGERAAATARGRCAGQISSERLAS